MYEGYSYTSSQGALKSLGGRMGSNGGIQHHVRGLLAFRVLFNGLLMVIWGPVFSSATGGL